MEATLLSIAGGIILVLLSVNGFFLRKDRVRLDKDITEVKETAKADNGLACQKAIEARTCAEQALSKVAAVELDTLKQFGQVHGHLSSVELNISTNLGNLRTMMAEVYATKIELREKLRN